jgi:hypothetical protein
MARNNHSSIHTVFYQKRTAFKRYSIGNLPMILIRNIEEEK